MSRDIDEIVRELTQGRGFVVLEGLFDGGTVAEARERILELAATKAPAVEKDDPLAVFDATDHVDHGLRRPRLVTDDPRALGYGEPGCAVVESARATAATTGGESMELADIPGVTCSYRGSR